MAGIAKAAALAASAVVFKNSRRLKDEFDR
jgi:hypothetical protein